VGSNHRGVWAEANGPEFQAFLTAQGETLNLVRGEELRERLQQETQAIGETLENLGLKQQ
jgi:tripartite-type tricarboxylate transporter receptor subunit TctC